MRNGTCLFFPDTRITPQDIVKLLSFFGNVTHYLPCEPDNNSAMEDDRLARLSAEELLTAYAPVPLGEDAQRYRKIIREFTSPQYGASSSPAQTIAAINDMDSRASGISSDQIIASIVGIAPDHSDEEQQKREELWGARLYLSLAEKHDIQEEELGDGLRQIDINQTTLLDSLAGADDDLKTAPRKTKSPENIITPDKAGSPQLEQMRLKAWTRLYLEEKDKKNTILVTSRQECVAALVDSFVAPDRIIQFSLPVPVIDIEDDNWFGRLSAIRQSLLEQAAALTDALCCNDHQAEQLKGLTTGWQKSLQKIEPSIINRWSFLNLFCFPLAAGELLSQQFRIPAPAMKRKSSADCCIIGLLAEEAVNNELGLMRVQSPKGTSVTF